MITPVLLTLPEVGKMIGVSSTSVRKLCDEGKLKFIRPLGPQGHRRVTVAEVNRFLDSLGMAKTPPPQAEPDPLEQIREARRSARRLVKESNK